MLRGKWESFFVINIWTECFCSYIFLCIHERLTFKMSVLRKSLKLGIGHCILGTFYYLNSIFTKPSDKILSLGLTWYTVTYLRNYACSYFISMSCIIIYLLFSYLYASSLNRTCWKVQHSFPLCWPHAVFDGDEWILDRE